MRAQESYKLTNHRYSIKNIEVFITLPGVIRNVEGFAVNCTDDRCSHLEGCNISLSKVVVGDRNLAE